MYPAPKFPTATVEAYCEHLCPVWGPVAEGIAHLADLCTWPHVQEYLRFMKLRCGKGRDAPLAAPPAVEQVWREHWCTGLYERFSRMMTMAGGVGEGRSSSTMTRAHDQGYIMSYDARHTMLDDHEERYAYTVELYREQFGEPPAAIWRAPVAAASGGTRRFFVKHDGGTATVQMWPSQTVFALKRRISSQLGDTVPPPWMQRLWRGGTQFHNATRLEQFHNATRLEQFAVDTTFFLYVRHEDEDYASEEEF